jgi:hypothetical protein
MRGILEIHKLIKDFALQSGYFSYFKVGATLEIPNSNVDNYPLMFLEEPISVGVTKTETNYSFAIIMGFPCPTDQSDELPFLSEHTHSLLLPSLRDYLTSKGYVNISLTGITISEYAEDNVSGLRVDISMTYKNAIYCVINESLYKTDLEVILDKIILIIDTEDRIPDSTDFTNDEVNNYVFSYNDFTLLNKSGYITVRTIDDYDRPIFCGLLYYADGWNKRYYKSMIHNYLPYITFALPTIPTIRYYKDITV